MPGQLLRAVASQSVSTYANQVVAFIVPWLVLARTGSALNAGTVAFATGVAAVVGALFGGVMVDRIGGRRAAMLADLASAGTVIVLPIALLADFLPLWLVIVTQTLGVLLDGPGEVARDTLIPSTAADDGVPVVRAASLQETLQGAARFAGPLTAGFLIAAIGERGTLWVAAGLFLVALALVAGTRRQHIAHEHPLTPRQAVRDMREGFRFLFAEPLLGPLTLLLVAWTAVFVPLSTVVFPAWFVLAGRDAAALGTFLGAQALGAILGGLAFAAVGTKVSRYAWFLPANVANTAALAGLLATEPGSVAAVALSFTSGLVSAGSLPIINTAYYTRTPRELLGRAQGASWALVLSALPLSSLLLGWLVQTTSPATALVTIAALNAAMILTFALIPALRLLDADPVSEPAEESA